MRKVVLKYRPDLWYKIGICGHITHYKTYESYLANNGKTTMCNECRHECHSQKLRGRKRQPFSEKWKRNLAIGHKHSEAWKQSMNTPEYKEKHRQKMLRMIKENKMSVAYNPKACEVFDFLNKKLNWNGLHAKNEKEKIVDVFYLDYYEPNLNVAIEWDERHHKKAKRRQYDGFRQKIVTDTIHCEFYRIDDITKTIKKVDNNLINRTQELQQVINEFYERTKSS